MYTCRILLKNSTAKADKPPVACFQVNARVPVTASGSIVAQDIIKSLKLASKTGRVKYNIIAADMSPLAAGLYICDAGAQVPPASSPDYVDAIVEICEKMSAQPVFCGSDDELLALASTKERIEKTGAKLLTGSLEVLAVARDKWSTYESCKANNLSCAPSALPEEREEFAIEFSYPLVIKPREGYDSIHFYVSQDSKEMGRAISAVQKGRVAPNLAKVLGRRQVHIRRHGRQELPVRNVVDSDSKDDQARS